MDGKIYQKVHPMIIGMMLTLLCLQVEAQEEREMRWQNVTSLTFAASNGTDKENALQQYLLFDEAVLYKHQDLYAQLETFSDEFTKNLLSQAVPEKLKEIDQTIADFKKNWAVIFLPCCFDLLSSQEQSKYRVNYLRKKYGEEYGTSECSSNSNN